MNRRLLPWLLPAALFLALAWPTLSGLASAWMNDDNYSHCFFIPAVSLAIAWSKRDALRSAPVRASGVGLAWLVASLLLLLVSRRGGIAVAERIAVVAGVNALVLYNAGWPVYRTLLFPLLFLVFMIPIPATVHGLFAFPLQLFSTDMAVRVLDWMRVPVEHAGNMIYVAAGALEVTEACSGIRSLVSFFTLGVLFAWRAGDRLVSPVLLASSILLALSVNIARVSLSGMIGAIYGVDAARGFLHDFSGLAFLVLGVALFSVEANVLQKAVSRRVP